VAHREGAAAFQPCLGRLQPITHALTPTVPATSLQSAIPLFLPPALDNHGNYIVSLSQMVRWLGRQAEELGAVPARLHAWRS
jgi:hypothetical protein